MVISGLGGMGRERRGAMDSWVSAGSLGVLEPGNAGIWMCAVFGQV